MFKIISKSPKVFFPSIFSLLLSPETLVLFPFPRLIYSFFTSHLRPAIAQQFLWEFNSLFSLLKKTNFAFVDSFSLYFLIHEFPSWSLFASSSFFKFHFVVHFPMCFQSTFSHTHVHAHAHIPLLNLYAGSFIYSLSEGLHGRLKFPYKCHFNYNPLVLIYRIFLTL